VDSAPTSSTWYRADLHIHTPGSIDYQEPSITPIDLLRTAVEQGLDFIALTDHNAVGGWVRLKHEIEDLEFLEHRHQLSVAEGDLLREYRELMDKVLVLPGLEFTATFGFHILAIFDPSTTIRMMEHLLLLLGVPEDRFGSGEVGATSDVLRAYDVLATAGAIVIGAHVNSTHGVAMRNIRFGGQTKIAYTQDRNLHALEVTDLASTSSRSTAHFFNGSKSEYSRRMHCIQGSDAHRLRTDPARPVNLGIGDRTTEYFLPTRSFAALKACLSGTDWDHVRAARSGGPAVIAVDDARHLGPSNTVAFVERSPQAAQTTMRALVRDIAAMANCQGGTIYCGVGPAAKKTVTGVGTADQVSSAIYAAVAEQIDPPCPVTIESLMYEQKPILIVRVPEGGDRPFALPSGEIPIRRGGETTHARRDEILILARGGSIADAPAVPAPAATPATARDESETNRPESQPPRKSRTRSPRAARPESGNDEGRISPRNGVEIVDVDEIDGVAHYTLRDLRNDQLTRNVTAATARSLWAQAIREYERGAPSADRVAWQGDRAFWKSTRISNGERRYHLLSRDADGNLHIYFGVSDDSLDPGWQAVIASAPKGIRLPAEPTE
jgi:hypothetical protein